MVLKILTYVAVSSALENQSTTGPILEPLDQPLDQGRRVAVGIRLRHCEFV